MGVWTYAIYDIQSGARLSPVFPSAGTWGRTLNQTWQGSHAFPLYATVNKGLDYDALLTPWQNCLVQLRNGIPQYAGLIIDPEWDEDSGLYTVQHADIRRILGRRTTLGTNGYGGVDGGRDVITNLTLDSIAARIIADGLTGPTPNYPLPIVLPSPVTSVFDRVYRDYNFPMVDQEVSNIQDYVGGPDTELLPQLASDGTLQWQFRSGYLTGGTFEFNMSVPKPPLFHVKRSKDGSNQATSVYAVGAGSEVDMLVKGARLASSPLPALERIDLYKDETDATFLQSYADTALSIYQNPTIQFSMSIMADGAPGYPASAVENMQLGSTVRLYYKGHPLIPDGWNPMRLVGITGDETEVVNLLIQPIGGS